MPRTKLLRPRAVERMQPSCLEGGGEVKLGDGGDERKDGQLIFGYLRGASNGAPDGRM